MNYDYSVTVTVTTDVQLDDPQLRDAITFMCVNSGLEPAMVSTDRDNPWLRIAAVTLPSPPDVDPRVVNTAADVVANVVASLGDALRHRGVTIVSWDTIEVISLEEVERRGRNRAIPPMVNAAELAQLAGVTPQRIYQYESDRKAGRGTGTFPAPVLDGYWLRSVAEHWVRYRRTKPGPAPRSQNDVDGLVLPVVEPLTNAEAAEKFTAFGKASARQAQGRRDRPRS